VGKLILLIILVLLSVPTLAGSPTLQVYGEPGTTTFAWDYTSDYQASIEPDGGFKLYMGPASGDYGHGVTGTAAPADRELTIDSSTFCGDRFFAMTAFVPVAGSPDEESGYSNEVTQAYVPSKATVLTRTGTSTFSWVLSGHEPYCVELGYHLYLSKTKGTYGPADIVATVGKGIGTADVDTTGYHGRWYAAVGVYTVGVDGRQIQGDLSNEVSIVLKPATPGNLRLVPPTE